MLGVFLPNGNPLMQKIKELYDYIFLVDTDLGVKSFSYIDVITKVIRIDY